MVNFRPKCCYICSRFSQQAAAGDDRKYSKPFFVVMVALIAGSGIMKGLLFYMINEVYTQSHSLLHNTKSFFFLSPPMQQQSAKCLAVKISFIIFFVSVTLLELFHTRIIITWSLDESVAEREGSQEKGKKVLMMTKLRDYYYYSLIFWIQQNRKWTYRVAHSGGANYCDKCVSRNLCVVVSEVGFSWCLAIIITPLGINLSGLDWIGQGLVHLLLQHT